jgi:HPt (histidine-containing phosphotransfer) domain-containing protein
MSMLNPETLAQLAEDLPPEVLAEVAQRYAEDCAAALAAMAAAADADGWHRAAHRLAGGASTVGADDVERQARAIMASPAPSPAALAALRQACASSAAAFSAWARTR